MIDTSFISHFYRRFDDPSIYPIPITYKELDWRLAVNFDPEEDNFVLSVNDVPVSDLPYQASSAPDAPQLVMNNSKIWLNNK